MAYDEALADRVRAALGARRGVTECRMFGGLAFLAGGRMCVGVLGRDLVARVARDEMPGLLAQPHVRPMDFTGRLLSGFVFVDAQGVATAAALRAWIERGLGVAAAVAARRPVRRPPMAAGRRRRLS